MQAGRREEVKRIILTASGGPFRNHSLEQLAEVTLQLARQIAAASPYTLGLGKRAFYEQLALDTERAYQLTEQVMVENARAPDALEGMQAFLEHRPPKWGKP